ncbi:Gfo/Idh/MocA family oxidoreductase [Marinobacterium rhizophilum]|uniref:Gfo/Idh/MocA family oxidoreductase n=1 Tax=Marinobacterium rhizophilum TaxID=420402 RepID=A0ABY5HL22_9GAMM|nr:Gfo/Idh/MocA family oxidoreductase [Marinobacterium rhizophilum]
MAVSLRSSVVIVTIKGNFMNNDNNRVFKVGVLGIGDISDVYINNLKQYGDIVRVVACAGRSLDKAQQKAAAHCIPRAYANTRQLLADSDIDIVLNLTVPGVHAQLNLAALQAGKHVYTEKPPWPVGRPAPAPSPASRCAAKPSASRWIPMLAGPWSLPAVPLVPLSPASMSGIRSCRASRSTAPKAPCASRMSTRLTDPTCSVASCCCEPKPVPAGRRCPDRLLPVPANGSSCLLNIHSIPPAMPKTAAVSAWSIWPMRSASSGRRGPAVPWHCIRWN